MKKTFIFKGMLCVILACLVVTSLISCSSKANDFAMYDTEGEFYSESQSAPAEPGFNYAADGNADYKYKESESVESSQTPKLTSQRKVIYSTEISIETKEYDKSIEALNSLIEKYGAYVENSDINNSGYSRYRTRFATYVIRIPKENYFSFVSESGNIGVITHSMDKNTDVTEKYIDTEARIETLKILEDRLLSLLEKSDTIEDIIVLEQKLSDTRYEIENLTGSLRKYDSLIAYSTATVHINEVEEIIKPQNLPKSFGEKISDSFKDSIKSIKNGLSDFAVTLVYVVPILLVVFLPVIIIVMIIIAWVKKAKKKKNKNNPTSEESQ